MSRPGGAERRAELARRSTAAGALAAWTASLVLHASVVVIAVRIGTLAEPRIGDGRPSGGGGEVEFEITVRAPRAVESAQPESAAEGDVSAPIEVAEPVRAPPPQPIDVRAIASALSDAWSRANAELTARAELTPSADPGVGGSLPVLTAPTEAPSTPLALAEEPPAPAPEAVNVARTLRDAPARDARSGAGDSRAAPADVTSSATGVSAGDGSSAAKEPGFGGHAGLALTFGPRPDYPPLSVRLGEEGHALCALTIRSDGVVERVDVIASSGHPRLDEAAKKALMRWRFRAPVPGAGADGLRIQHRVTFRLE
ncbi:MAG: energy transducer TonB [Planctomycetota bacterium]